MSSGSQILITDDIHPYFIDSMSAWGCRVDYRPKITRQEVLQVIEGYDVLLVNSRIPADRELLEKAVKLRVVARIGSGLEVIDTHFAAARKIVCLNAPEGNKDAVAEHALGMLLTLFRHIHRAHYEVRQGLWHREENRGTELGGKIIGIIGYGNNGSAFAEKLKGMNVTVLAYDKYKTGFAMGHVREVALEDIFYHADVLSLHIPLTDETLCLVNDEFIRRFRKSFYLINVSRGKVIDTAALVRHLRAGKVLGACLDVLENEQLHLLTPEQHEWFVQLQCMDNVVLTPHIAGWTHESKLKIAQVLALKLQQVLSS